MVSHVSILVAPPSQRPILAALTDLSAAGVLRPFYWMEVAPGSATLTPNARAIRVDAGQAQPTVWHEIVSRHGIDLVRVVVLVPLGHDAADSLSPMEELDILNLPVSSEARTCRLRVLIPWSSKPREGIVGHPGWVNVMLSPESTADPAFPATAWWDTPASIPGAAAVGVAVQAALATSMTAAPMDEAAPAVGSSVVVARSFVRRTDARSVEEDLRRAVLDVGNTFPQPMRVDAGGSDVPPFPDAAVRVKGVADAWYLKHQGSLRRQPAPMPEMQQEQMGAWAALKLFFSFMSKALLGAPGNWLRSQIHAAKAGVASSVQGFVFGHSSAVSVVVGGVDSSGRSASWRELSTAAREASALMPAVGLDTGAPRPRRFGALWRDLVYAVQALVDGAGYPELGIRAYEGYVRDRDAIAPPMEGVGTYVFRTDVGPFPAGTRLASWDQFEVERVLTELATLAQQVGPAQAQARRAWGEISQWQQQGTYRLLQLLGSFLTQLFQRTRGEIQSYEAQLRALLEQDVTADLERRQRRLARILRILLVVFLIVMAIVVSLAVIDTTTWDIAATLCGVLFVAWLISSIVTFMVQQREVFRLLHQARATDALIPALEANLRQAIEDLAAQGEAYAQFDQWARILTTFLSDPLGERDQAAEVSENTVVMPAGLQSVTAQVDSASMDRATAQLRLRVFHAGWLHDAWDALARTIERDLTPEEALRYQRHELDIYSESGTDDSALVHWVQGLAREGVPSQIGQTYWEACLAALADGVDAHLAVQITTPRGEPRMYVDYRRDLEEFRQSGVVTDVFAPGRYAGAESRTTPEAHWFREYHNGLSTTMVMTDTTAALTSDYFVYPAPTAEQERVSASNTLIY